MTTLLFRCRVCKKTQRHRAESSWADEFGLPDTMAMVECLGCGVTGIELIENQIKSTRDQLLDELGKTNA
jgi:hypothetical protein